MSKKASWVVQPNVAVFFDILPIFIFIFILCEFGMRAADESQRKVMKMWRFSFANQALRVFSNQNVDERKERPTEKISSNLCVVLVDRSALKWSFIYCSTMTFA